MSCRGEVLDGKVTGKLEKAYKTVGGFGVPNRSLFRDVIPEYVRGCFVGGSGSVPTPIFDSLYSDCSLARPTLMPSLILIYLLFVNGAPDSRTR